MNFVAKIPMNLVELSSIDDFASFGVPRPEMINTIFFFNLSHFASHFGIRTARSGKNVASITQPGLLLLSYECSAW